MADSGWTDPHELENKMKEYGGPTVVNINDAQGQKFQTCYFMLQAVRLREQVRESQRLARYTFWMAFFVGVASLAQIITVALAFLAG